MTIIKPCAFDDLPFRKDGPAYNAWGAWGHADELGRLNLITPESIKRGKEEIKDGIVINLNLPMRLTPIHPARNNLEHKIANRGHCNDDILTFNTQGSTQWDGFRHYPYQNWPKEGEHTYYEGMTSDDAKDPKISRNGIQNYVKRPVTSRAHLLDIPRHLSRTGQPPLSPLDTTTPITSTLLASCAEAQGITFHPGDILLVRTGFTEVFFDLGEEGQKGLLDREKREWGGVDAGEETLRWHWDNGIAAVASDSVAYEVYPSPHTPSIHEVFLAGWGMPIGELFDLRELAATCEKLGRWTFFFTSMVLNVEGGIASPPNAQAIL